MMVQRQKLGLGRKIILAAAGLAGLVSLGGCAEAWAQIEKNAEANQQWLKAHGYTEEKTFSQKAEDNQAWLKAHGYDNTQNGGTVQGQPNNQTDPSEKWVWDAYKKILVRVGSNVLTHEYIQSDTK